MNCLQCDVEIEPPKRRFCSREHKNSYNQKNLYNYKYTKAYRSRSPENFLRHLLSYKSRSKTISIEDLLELYEKQKGLCAISGEPMTYEQSGGKVPSNISIDRIDSSKGYTPSNLQLVCSVVNTMKMHYSTDELLKWCKKIVDNQS